MNLLVTTLGMSWQIVPELYGFTNPKSYDFFKGNTEAEKLRQEHRIEPVDALWVITVEAQKDLDKLRAWAKHWQVDLRILVCQGINEFATQGEILAMRSFIYRVVLNARHETKGKLYLSLTGGRKTMSADMQEAGNLFGCDAMLHIVDFNLSQETKNRIKDDELLDVPGQWSAHYMPVWVNGPLECSMVVAGGNRALEPEDFPLPPKEKDILFHENDALAREIARRKAQSSQLYANFYQRLTNNPNSHARDVFRKLYFLHPDIVHALQRTSPTPEILRAFPKADLHTHLGGVLSAKEIIAVALAEEKRDAPDPRVQDAVSHQDLDALRALREQCLANKRENFRAFHPHFLAFIAAFNGHVPLFERLIFGEYLDPARYHRIDIDPYQALGDFQGSSLLQTRATLSAAVHAYAEQLKDDHVHYVEIRCSPYKYTRMGLTESEVVDIIMETLDGYQAHFDYRLIAIIGRQADDRELSRSVDNTLALLKSNTRFAGKLAGIDLAGNEGARPPAELRPHFMPFLEKCLHITIHAGETAPAENIWEAVYHLSADRIGHGLKLIDREDLLGRFVDKNIGIEMCPSSNDQIVGFQNSEYPLKKYMEAGLKVTVNTDNAGISRTTLTDEFMKAAEFCDLSLWECITLIRNSLTTAFLDATTKKRTLLEFENKIHDWCLAHRNDLLA